MKYYAIAYNYNKSDDLLFLHFNEAELPFDRYDINRAVLLPCSEVYCSIEHGTIQSDYLANNLSFLIVSEKVRYILEGFNLCRCQFIEVREKNSKNLLGYLINCVEHYTALDVEKSICQHFPDNKLRPLIVIRYAILEEKINGKDLFQLQESTIPYFISERVKRKLAKEKVIGFDFERVIYPDK